MKNTEMQRVTTMSKTILGKETDRKNVSADTLKTYIEKLRKMVNCKTVFTRDGANNAEYEKFYEVLRECFPLLHEKAEKLTFGTGCFVFVIRGRNAKKNIMLMSHHDVVDGDSEWKTDPFNAVEKTAHSGAEAQSTQKLPFLLSFRRLRNYSAKVMILTA